MMPIFRSPFEKEMHDHGDHYIVMYHMIFINIWPVYQKPVLKQINGGRT